MNEARESLNVRFLFRGFDCQYTRREDQERNDLLPEFLTRLDELEAHGAAPPGRQPTTPDSNGQPPPDINGQPPPPEPPTCKTCDSTSHMELVTFRRNGQDRSAWKCQECKAWHYPKDDAKKKERAKK